MMNFYKILIFLTALLVNNSYAQGKILIVNSDSDVYRYKKIAIEFKSVVEKNAYQSIDFNAEHYTNVEAELKKVVQQENPDIIFSIGTKAYSVARNYAKDKAVLFSAVINWRRLGLNDKSYGVANELSPAQEISLLRYFFPAVKKIGLIYSDFNRLYLEEIKKDAAPLGMQIIERHVNNTDDVAAVLEELLPKIDIFWVISDPVVLENKDSVQQMMDLIKQQQKPVYAYSDTFIKYGAILTVSPDTGTIGRQSANLIMSLKDNKIPVGTVQIPAGSNVVLNTCLVEALKIKFNKDALDSVNKIINCDEQNND